MHENPLVDESKDLATDVLVTGLDVVHDTGRGGKDDLTERSGREELRDPVLNRVDGDVEPGGDDTTLVQSAVELDNNLATSVVVDDLELANVAVLLHDRKNLDNDLGGRSDEDLSLSSSLGVDDVVKGVVKNGDSDHLDSFFGVFCAIKRGLSGKCFC